jgi:hypothetical protein
MSGSSTGRASALEPTGFDCRRRSAEPFYRIGRSFLASDGSPVSPGGWRPSMRYDINKPDRHNGGLLVQARGLECASGEPILRQDLGVFMGIKQAWLKQSLAPFLAPTKYR